MRRPTAGVSGAAGGGAEGLAGATWTGGPPGALGPPHPHSGPLARGPGAHGAARQRPPMPKVRPGSLQ